MRIPTIPPRRIPKTGDDTPARSLLRYVWRMSGWHQVWICLLALGVAALSMVPLELQRRLVNEAIGEADVNLLALLGGLYLAVVLVQNGSKYLLRIYQSWLSESAVRYSRAHLAGLEECRAATRNGSGQGRAVSVIGPELDTLGGFVGEGLSQPVVNFGMLVAMLGYMLVVQPTVTLISLCFLLPQVAVVPAVQRILNRLIEERVELLRQLGDSVAEIGDGQGDGAVSEKPGPHVDSIYANRMRISFVKFALKTLVNFLNALAPLSVLIVGGYLAIQGETTIGVIVAFITGFERLADPLREILAFYRIAAQASVQHQMIARWM